MRCLVVGEYAFFSNEVKDHFIVKAVADIAANQLSIPYYGPYVWSTLNQKIPLTLYPIHLFLLKFTQSLIGSK